jgi:hypothetical protein
MKSKIPLLILAALMLLLVNVQAQEKNDTIRKEKKKVKPEILTPYHKNVIKFNPTPMLIQGMEIRNITFSYERLITKNMSLALQIGYLIFPEVMTGEVLGGLINIYKGTKQGINLALDYRYYPFQRNRRPAPDGLYLGGFTSYYGFKFENSFDILDSALVQNGSLKGNLNAFYLGVELGYQFIFWKRFTVDLLLFGPAVAYYSGSLTFNGNLNQETIDKLDDELVQKLENRFPLIKSFASGEELRFSGSRAKFGIGLRYSIQLGFHF